MVGMNYWNSQWSRGRKESALDDRRLHNAQELWCAGSIKETALRLDYTQQSNFNRQYKSQTGICPSLQRLKITKSQAENVRK